ncbi:MAG: DUF4595 domain-containing protein [Bacteroides sp.]|nr:DUF4595 domain-containing protein [Roseburia sp.]MCM1345497.1 DUF4595 domain-containing protein [Bacteroides sp.]MCM1420006.1 DUF4595 domain-containing protein [Bacteroides sp.]
MKKLIRQSFAALAAIIALSACSDDDNKASVANRITTPNTSGYSKLVSVERAGSFQNMYAWRFGYSGNNLVQAVSTLQHSNDMQSEGNKANYSLSYGERTVGISTNGVPMSVALNEEALVSKATSGNTTYNYSYTGGYLTSWKVLYQNNGFGGSSTKGATAELSRTVNGNITEIKYTPSADAPDIYYTYSFEYTQDDNVNGLLPEAISKVMGCEGFEYIYYAGLLGRGTQNLVKSITVTHSKNEEETAYEFFYNFDTNRNTITCSYGKGSNTVVVTYKYQ